MKTAEKQELAAIETHERQPSRVWRTRRHVSLILFLVISLIFEVVVIYTFLTLGLTDQHAWTSVLTIPGANWSFVMAVSPLFHLLPIAVIIVLLASWTYLAKSTTMLPQREIPRRTQTLPRAQEIGRPRTTRRFFRDFNRRLQRIGRTVKSGFGRIPGVSYVSRRLSSSRASVRSGLMVLLIFISIAVGFVFVAYPNLIHDLTVNLYRGFPALADFITGTNGWFRNIGTAVPALGDFVGSISNAFIKMAPGFRRTLEAAGMSITTPIFQLDVVGKYILGQNLGSWTAAVLAILYGWFASTRRRIRSR